MGEAMATIDLGAILFQIHHVFLPPLLPQADDTNVFHEKVLLETVHSALKAFQEYYPTGQRKELARCARMIDFMERSRDSNGLLDLGIVEERISNLGDLGQSFDEYCCFLN